MASPICFAIELLLNENYLKILGLYKQYKKIDSEWFDFCL